MTATATKIGDEPVERLHSMNKRDAEAFKISDRVRELMVQHGTAPYPETYAFWFAYVAGANETLVATINKMIKRDGEISQYEIDEVCRSVTDDEKLDVKQDKIRQAVSEQVSSVVDLVRTGLSQSDEFNECLTNIGAGLPSAASDEDIRETLSKLIEENARMAERSRKLHEGLEASQKQIAQLSVELEDVRQLSSRDPLTGAANRRAFDSRLDREIHACTETEKPMCLVLADIDHFKMVNDTFGHQVGDEVLKVFASILRKNVKGRDLVSRYGGEEFAIILPDTQIGSAFKLVDNIREQWASKRLLMRQSRQQLGQITASFGIATYEQGFDPADLIEKADLRLYRAKHNGRNQVCAVDTD